MSLTRFHPLEKKILSQNLQAVADQGCHLKGFSLIRAPLIGGYTVLQFAHNDVIRLVFSHGSGCQGLHIKIKVNIESSSETMNEPKPA
jgi:hypothetical protein